MKETDQSSWRPKSNKQAGKGTGRIVFFLALIVILILAILVMTLPQFYIEKITIVGCHEITKEEIYNSSGLRAGDHIMKNIGGGLIPFITLRYGNIEKVLCSNYPYIRDIKIRIDFPSGVLCTVDERKKIGYAKLPDGYAVIDADGYVVELFSDNIPAGVPLMEGLPIQTAVLGGKIDMSDEKGLTTCIAVLSAIIIADENDNNENSLKLIKCVKNVRFVYSGTTFLTIILPESNKEFLVRIGSLKDINEDMSWLRYAVEQQKLGSFEEGVLDMSGEEYTFRPAR